MQFNLRIEDSLNEELIKIAKREKRSKNSQIEYILKSYVEEYKEKHTTYNIESHDSSTQNINIKE